MLSWAGNADGATGGLRVQRGKQVRGRRRREGSWNSRRTWAAMQQSQSLWSRVKGRECYDLSTLVAPLTTPTTL